MTKRQIAALARRSLAYAAAHRAYGNAYAASRYAEHAASLTRELHRRIFTDKLAQLISRFPVSLTFY